MSTVKKIAGSQTRKLVNKAVEKSMKKSTKKAIETAAKQSVKNSGIKSKIGKKVATKIATKYGERTAKKAAKKAAIKAGNKAMTRAVLKGKNTIAKKSVKKAAQYAAKKSGTKAASKVATKLGTKVSSKVIKKTGTKMATKMGAHLAQKVTISSIAKGGAASIPIVGELLMAFLGGLDIAELIANGINPYLAKKEIEKIDAELVSDVKKGLKIVNSISDALNNNMNKLEDAISKLQEAKKIINKFDYSTKEDNLFAIDSRINEITDIKACMTYAYESFSTVSKALAEQFK